MIRPGIRTSQAVGLSLGVGAFFTAQEVFMALATGRPVNVQRDLLQEVYFWLIWAFLTPIVLAAAARWPLDERPVTRAAVLHTGTAVLLAIGQVALAFALIPLVQWADGSATAAAFRTSLVQSRAAMVWGMFMGVFFYWVVVAVYTALRFRGLYAAEQVSAAQHASRSAQLSAELTQAKLDSLRSQLRPHFLFNALNTISVLAGEDAGKTQQMLLRLSSLLRRSLDVEDHQVALRRELEFLDDYLDIQRVRFGDRLRIELEVDPAALDAPVPVLVLQPIMENAIEHGASDDACTTVTLHAARTNGVLEIIVQDSGPGIDPAATLREGIGLRNTRARLQQLYGNRASVELGSAHNPGPNGGARVVMRLPVVPVAP